ncbi:phosphatidylinositol mannoside acyltransferase [uncultured Pseudokineococcus sp.]|uniref:phosphatidylinositol mannoside acyltransferase n=1 Tax=uncultured Pseudokineococcus sp. TaxID=1642928 RepID=UPI0026399B78|nr:phosphatidylinositol mannoside acyltransferase [uncultured Pseudokineococcus sp.]
MLLWRTVVALPEPLVRAAAAAVVDVAWVVALSPVGRRAEALAGVRHLVRNLEHARPGLAPWRARLVLRAALRSHARAWVDTFVVDTWSEERRRRAVRFVEDEELRAALAVGGAVVALTHSASWDVLGAWGPLEMGPTTTVVERLADDDVFEAFVRARAAVGIEALPHTGAAPPLPQLVRRVRSGSLVPLLVDRDLGGAAVEVDFLGGRARLASGAAALADLADAPLFAFEAWYERDRSVAGGWVVLGRPHRVERVVTGPRPQRVAATTQACADLLAAALARHPQDWHLLSPVLLPGTEPGPGAGGPVGARPEGDGARTGAGS